MAAWRRGVHARDHVNAGGDHGGGVDQRADRRGAFHGVRQPDVERELRGFADGADEEQQANRGEDADLARCLPWASREALAKMEEKSSERKVQKASKIPIVKPMSPMRVVMKAFLPASAADFFQEPEADQQIAAEAHAFPSDEHQGEVRGHDQSEHEEHEEIQIGEEAVVAAFVGHVAGGINVNEQANAGDDQKHDQGELVDLEIEVGAEIGRPGSRDLGANPGNGGGGKGGEFADRAQEPRER